MMINIRVSVCVGESIGVTVVISRTQCSFLVRGGGITVYRGCTISTNATCSSELWQACRDQARMPMMGHACMDRATHVVSQPLQAACMNGKGMLV